MKLHDIKYLLDLRNITDVNNYLQKGWVLLNMYTVSYDPDICKNHLIMHYVIGATSDVDYSEELEPYYIPASNSDSYGKFQEYQDSSDFFANF